MSLARRGWGVACGWMLLWWVGDMTCLAVAVLAVGGTLPWRALLIAYAAGQFAALLPITPGGLGVTEGSMAVTLAAYGGGMAAAARPNHGFARRHHLVFDHPADAEALPNPTREH